MAGDSLVFMTYASCVSSSSTPCMGLTSSASTSHTPRLTAGAVVVVPAVRGRAGDRADSGEKNGSRRNSLNRSPCSRPPRPNSERRGEGSSEVSDGNCCPNGISPPPPCSCRPLSPVSAADSADERSLPRRPRPLDVEAASARSRPCPEGMSPPDDVLPAWLVLGSPGDLMPAVGSRTRLTAALWKRKRDSELRERNARRRAVIVV